MRKAVCLLYLLFYVQAWAGEVVLKNGDRLTGKIIRMDKTSLDLETNLLGKVTIPTSAIVKIDSDTQLYVSVGDNETVKGSVSMRDGRFEVRAKDQDSRKYARDTVRAIRSEEEQRAFVSRPVTTIKEREPGLFDLWGGSLDTAISIARGNSDTKTVNVGLRAARITPRNSTRLYFLSIFSQTAAAGRPTGFAESFRGGSRYEINFSRRFFTFGFTDLEHDQFQGLDSRMVGGGGLGMNLIKNKKTSFQVFSGGSANREGFRNGLRRMSREFVAGNDLTRQLTPTTSVTESLIVYPNLSSLGQYRVTFDSSIVTQLNKWLAWHVTASNRYASSPASGVKNNDLLLTTGIRFVHRGEALQNVEARPELRRR
jgi:putative salt-induced outer membrane protein YdiY